MLLWASILPNHSQIRLICRNVSANFVLVAFSAVDQLVPYCMRHVSLIQPRWFDYFVHPFAILAALTPSNQKNTVLPITRENLLLLIGKCRFWYTFNIKQILNGSRIIYCARGMSKTCKTENKRDMGIYIHIYIYILIRMHSYTCPKL